MSNRANTRNKNKRLRSDNNAEVVAALYRKIHLSGEVSKDDIKQLYMLEKPLCYPGCRVNTKDNPNCFCGLIPPPNGNRKSGLWQKMSEIIAPLGDDPSKELRDSLNTPAGLSNLGATCYANSILQFLYMNKSFREGVLSIEPEVLEKQPVLDQIARLFAQLHSSNKASIDSARFIEALALDNGIQQDSHEFLTLLFSLLEQCLSYSKVAKARSVVQNLFRGGVSHVTKCSKCGNQSEASSNVEDFYGVELNVKGLKSLDESLDDYLSVEELQGDNQYFCSSCATRVDATRSIKLQSLPPVLIFQLKRCIFLPNTTTKKKITSAFCFPGQVDMARWLSEQSKSELVYDLSAVLIHKGSTVNSGHYVAHIKDQDTGLWWEFDDDVVTELGHHPFGGNSSKSSAKPLQTVPAGQSGSSEPEAAVNGNHMDISGACETATHVQTFSSTDAYMLMYSLRNQTNGHISTQMGSGELKLKDQNSVSLQNADYLPPHLLKEVNELNKSYSESCLQHTKEKEATEALVKGRRHEVRSVISEAPVQSPAESFRWISTDWLRKWADEITPMPIDNKLIQCEHGKVPVSKISSMKRISTKAWNTILSKCEGGPELGEDDCCIECLKETARSTVSADSYRDGRTSLRELAESALAGKCRDGEFDGELYYVSKSWLSQWVRRRNIDSPSEADTGPTAAIRCPHGALLPEHAAGAKRTLVPENLWLFIYKSANEVKPDDMIGCSVFPSDSDICPQCHDELSEVTCQEDSLRDFKIKQRQSHEKLALGKSVPLFPENRYYLMPTSWLSKWRSYVTAVGKNASSIEQPEDLNTLIDSLKCQQHSGLLQRPPNLIRKRDTILQKASAVDELTIVTENDWTLFCKDWNGIKGNGMSAELDITVSSDVSMLGTSEEMPIITEENGNSSDDANGETDSQVPTIKTYPQVCEECIGERESCELVRKLNYSNEDICICFVRGKEPPKYILEGSANMLEPNNRRISKRSRRTPYGNSVNLNVSGSTTLYELKMMIWQSFGIVKENQILHKGSKMVDGETSTLADMCIFPGDVMWVTDSEIHENRDIADELSDTRMEEQGGFRGTLLTSNIHSQVMSQECYN